MSPGKEKAAATRRISPAIRFRALAAPVSAHPANKPLHAILRYGYPSPVPHAPQATPHPTKRNRREGAYSFPNIFEKNAFPAGERAGERRSPPPHSSDSGSSARDRTEMSVYSFSSRAE